MTTEGQALQMGDWVGRGFYMSFPPLPRYSEKAATHPITSESQDQHPAQRG